MLEKVKNYYGKVLQDQSDLKTDACCSVIDLPEYIKTAISTVHPDVLARFYGCGLVVPPLLSGLRVLDLGCGSGRDCYVLSQLVGESGYVVGVDMTDEQLAVARRYIEYHTHEFGYARANVEFRQGYIEVLDDIGLESESFDIIVSNCVINLSPDKRAVLAEAYRLLKPGGELYFADIYADRRVPSELRDDPVLYGECLGGALYWNDFNELAKLAGFADPRLVEDRPIAVGDTMLADRLGNIQFYSATYRLFKLPELEPACEDYGQAVRYRGSVPNHEQVFRLDKHHAIERGGIFPVCGNTYRMLSETRFRPHFEFFGDWSVHHGIFEGCGTAAPFNQTRDGAAAACC